MPPTQRGRAILAELCRARLSPPRTWPSGSACPSRRSGATWRGTHEVQGRHRVPFGKYEIPVVDGALIWLAYELIILIGPAECRDARTAHSAHSAWGWCCTWRS